jgi:CBS domain containing-hemolysin-like protein
MTEGAKGMRSFLAGLGIGKPREERATDGDATRTASDGIDSLDGVDPQAERREMIRGVQELGDTTVKEVMVPRTDTFFVAIDAGRDQLLEAVVSSGHSRIPVYRGTIDDVVGVLYAKDLLKSLVVGGEFSLPALLRKPFFVPETKRIDALLREFKRRRVHIAISVDEYGGVSGIVCLEDIIEEIVGEIQDEFDEEREDIVALDDGSWLCDARVNLEDLNERCGLTLPADDFDTLGGFVFDLFGRIPLRGEGISAAGLDFLVQEIEGHRIELVRVTRSASPAVPS